jgi:hypothetical protein
MSDKIRFPDHAKLVEAGKFANELLIKKGFQRKETLKEILAEMDNPPILPGMPPYLPHKNTIVQAVNMMYNLCRDWQEENKDQPEREENIVEFTTFVVKRFQALIKKYRKQCNRVPTKIKKMKNDVPSVAEVFKPLTVKQNTVALNKFFIDSFAVAIMVKQYATVSEYIDWFLNDWAPNLYRVWGKNNEKIIHTS